MRELSRDEIQQIGGGGAQAWLDPLMGVTKQARRVARSTINKARAQKGPAHHLAANSNRLHQRASKH